MSNRESVQQQPSGLVNPSVLAPGDDESLEPGDASPEQDEIQDPDQADLIPKVGAEAEEGVEDEDTAEDDDTDDEDEDDDADVDAVEDGEVEEGSGGHV